MNIAIIPARSGSKRIKNKNTKLFLKRPLLFYSIKLALKSKIFKKVIVSTDSNRIAKLANSYGAEVPFIRPKNISDDYTITSKVLLHAVKTIDVKKIKYICRIYPTAVLLREKFLKKGLKKIKKIKLIVALV